MLLFYKYWVYATVPAFSILVILTRIFEYCLGRFKDKVRENFSHFPASYHEKDSFQPFASIILESNIAAFSYDYDG